MQLQMPCIYRCNRYHYRMLSISIDFQLITIIFFTKQFANGFQFLLIFDGNKNEMLSIINMENTNLIFEKNFIKRNWKLVEELQPSRNAKSGHRSHISVAFSRRLRKVFSFRAQEKLRKFGTCESRVRKWKSDKK